MKNRRAIAMPLIIAALGAVVILIGVIALVSHDGRGDSHNPSSGVHNGRELPTETPQEKAAAQAATEHAVAETRIASLTFKCIERYVCHLFPASTALPLFIDGMDEPFVEYLSDHGYADSWRDNTGFVHGHTIGPRREFDHYVAGYSHGVDLPIGTGLIFEPEEEIVGQATGPYLGSLPPNGRWVITWQLKNSVGKVVRELMFSIAVKECSEYEGPASYCAKVGKYEGDEANDGMTNSNEYSAAFYMRPPLFPY
jgi:hypothetical protein